MLSLTAGLLLAPLAAHAGSYVGAFTDPNTLAPTPYSGGTHYSTTGPPVQGTSPFAAVPDGLSDGSYGGASSGDGNGGNHSDCSGAISTSWTWVPATGQTATTDPPPTQVIIMQTCSGSVTCNPPTVSGGGATGTYYSVQSGGATVTLNTLSATATTSNAPSSAIVGYTAAVYPVTINPGGAIQDSSGYKILVGQGCSPTLSAGPATLSNFQWSSGPVFDQFLIASDQSVGYATFLSAAALTQPNPHWHYYLDSGKGAFAVHCTATASMNGQAIGTVTGSRDLTVVAPYYFNHNAGPTGIYGSDVSTGGKSLMPPGMTFVGAVGTPPLFTNSNGTGSWLFVQIINTNHFQYYSFSPTPISSGSQGIALDTIWPYSSSWPADSTAEASTPHSADDSPDLMLNSGIDEFAITDMYQMYMMYLPPAMPGFDTQYVPLHRLTWTWNTPDSKNIGGWPAGAAGTVGATSDLRWETHPAWTKKYTKE